MNIPILLHYYLIKYSRKRKVNLCSEIQLLHFSKSHQASKNLDLYTDIISPLGSSPIKRSKFSVR